jgi:hypothetical protein
MHHLQEKRFAAMALPNSRPNAAAAVSFSEQCWCEFGGKMRDIGGTAIERTRLSDKTVDK